MALEFWTIWAAKVLSTLKSGITHEVPAHFMPIYHAILSISGCAAHFPTWYTPNALDSLYSQVLRGKTQSGLSANRVTRSQPISARFPSGIPTPAWLFPVVMRNRPPRRHGQTLVNRACLSLIIIYATIAERRAYVNIDARCLSG